MRRWLVVALMLATACVWAQELSFSPNPLNMGTVHIGGTIESSTLTITNTGSVALSLDISCSDDAFTVTPSSVDLAIGQQTTVSVRFEGDQNIHYAEVLFAVDEGHGLCRALAISTDSHDSDSYYDQTYNQWDTTLKTTLHGMIDNQDPLGYNNARRAMFGTIDNENGRVQCVYTGQWEDVEEGTIPDADIINTEHTWPQSRFEGISEESTAKCDLNHLYPTLSGINSTRGNYPFGEVTDQSGSLDGSLWGYNDDNVYCFEPRDPHKGDCARSMFYFSIRYSNPQSFLNAQEATLRTWYYQDPVSTKETTRNDAIEDAQGNRNPFVDRPQLLERIYSVSTTTARPSVPELITPLETIDFDSVLPSHDEVRYLVMANTGTGTITVQSVTVNSPDYTVGTGDNSLAASEFTSIPITFSSSTMGAHSATLSVTTSAGNLSIPLSAIVSATSADDETIPSVVRVGPNPFTRQNGGIRFSSASPEKVEFTVYSLRGQKVRQWTTHEVTWDGCNSQGKPLPEGVYLLRVTTPTRTENHKLLLLQ
jgi:endonuclease I